MNTQCTPEPMLFSSLNSQKVQADFDGGALTTDAGALLLREVDRRIGLVDALNACLADPRDGRYTVHDQRSMLAQRIFGIAAGYEDLNDHATLRDDPCFKGLAGTSLENAQAGTIRTRLLKIGTLVRSSARRVVFHLASGFPLQDVFRTAFARLMALPNPSLTSG